MVTIPRKDTTGRSLLECFSTKLGIPPNILKIYWGCHLITGQKTYAIPSGTFLSATLGLPGGNRSRQLPYCSSTTYPNWNSTHPEPRPPGKDSTKARRDSSKARSLDWLPPVQKRVTHQMPPSQRQPGPNAASHLWLPSKKDINRRAHTVNGNPGKSPPQPAQQNLITLEVNRTTHLAEDTSTLWDKWKSMLKLAR